MEDFKIRAAMDKVDDALELSRHFQSGTRAYQEYLARDAAQKALKIQEGKIALKKMEEAPVRQIPPREGKSKPSAPPKPKRKPMQKKKNVVPPLISRKHLVTPLPQRPKKSYGVPLVSGREAKEVTSIQALKYMQVNRKPFTIRNLRDLMNKASISRIIGASGQSDPEPELRPIPQTPFHKELLNSLAKLGLETKTGSTSSQSALDNGRFPGLDADLDLTENVVERPKSESDAGSKSPRARGRLTIGRSSSESKMSMEFNANLNSIIENLKALGDGIALDSEPQFIMKEENFDHLAKIRPVKEELSSRMIKCRFPPGIQHKATPADGVYYGYPYFTKGGSVVDAQAEYLASHYPKPGFNNDLNMTEVTEMIERPKKKGKGKVGHKSSGNPSRKN